MWNVERVTQLSLARNTHELWTLLHLCAHCAAAAANRHFCAAVPTCCHNVDGWCFNREPTYLWLSLLLQVTTRSSIFRRRSSPRCRRCVSSTCIRIRLPRCPRRSATSYVSPSVFAKFVAVYFNSAAALLLLMPCRCSMQCDGGGAHLLFVVSSSL
jgi:hypothetical protein